MRKRDYTAASSPGICWRKSTNHSWHSDRCCRLILQWSFTCTTPSTCTWQQSIRLWLTVTWTTETVASFRTRPSDSGLLVWVDQQLTL